jgi:YHS domain-containing protein
MASAKDRVCGMTLDTDKATAQSTYQGRTYYFCSLECERRFQAQPERYTQFTSAPLADIGVPLEKHEPPFTQAGGFPAPKFGSATSGGAEFEPGPERHTDNDAR